MLDCGVSLVIRGLEFAVGPVGCVRFMVKAAVGERTTKALVKEQKQQRQIDTLGGQATGVAASVALDEPLPFEFSQIVTELVESVLFRGDLTGGEDCLVDLLGGPATDGAAVMQQNLQQPDHPGVVDFDAGVTN